MKLIEITSIDEIASFKEKWEELFLCSGSDNPFLSWGWNYAWCKEYGQQYRMRILVVTKNERAIAIAPLMKTGDVLKFLADDLFADYMDFLVAESYCSEVLELIMNYLVRDDCCRRIVFRPLQGSSTTISFMKCFLPSNGYKWRLTVTCNNPYVDTGGSFKEYYQQRSKRLRQELRTTENRLNKEGRWTFFKAETPEDSLKILNKLISFHTQRQDNKAGTSIFSCERNSEFFRRLVQQNSNPENVNMHLSALVLGDHIVSAALSIKCNRVLYYWIPSFDPKIQSVSLGKLHIKCLVEKCFQGDVVRFDFMGGEETYKLQWATNQYLNHQISIYKYMVDQILDEKLESLKSSLRNLKNGSKLFQWLWTRVSKL